MPKVLNKSTDGIPEGAVLVDRSSQWGNPFVMGTHGDRDLVCAKFEVWLLKNPEMLAKVRAELKGKDLVCHCAPKRCHADVLLREANK